MKRLLALLLINTLGCAASPELVIRHSQDKVVKLGMVLQRTSPDTNEQEYAHGVCSGAFINNSGLVLTCAHCVSSRFLTKVFVKTEDETAYPGYVVKISTDNDLALVQMLTNHYTPYFKLGKEVERGQQVLLFGSPLRLQHTVSVGYIENIFDKGFLGMPHVVAINSAPINGGNSGGPLVDLHGRLVGVGEGSIMANFFVPADGLGFAVDLESIREFLK
jgi:S1-C subfamily serine protease